jgi:hypothetical protein
VYCFEHHTTPTVCCFEQQPLFLPRTLKTGGPAVTKPTRRGFGSVILLVSAKHFDQSVELDYAPRGLCYELQVQLNTIEASNKWMERPE